MLLLCSADGAKLRPWLDSKVNMIEGDAPAARNNHGVSATEDGKVYVFGGRFTNAVPNAFTSDLHVYDPASKAWTGLSAPAAATPPSARLGHGFSAAGGRLYVHGGNSGNGPVADLHQYNPTTQAWSNLTMTVTGSLPSPRYFHGFTASGTLLYVHGGMSDSGVLGDLHLYDPATYAWTNLSMHTVGDHPKSRRSHGFSADGNFLYIHGGKDGNGFLADLHAFNLNTKTWSDLSVPAAGVPPSSRNFHGVTIVQGRLYVHGGRGENGLLNDLHVYDVATHSWTDISTPSIGLRTPARWGHGLTAAAGLIYVHGGEDNSGYLLADLHVYDPNIQAWTDLLAQVAGVPPSARESHGFTTAEGRLYVHGGTGQIGSLADLLVYDNAIQTWKDLSAPLSGMPPSARWGHGFFGAGAWLYIFGGVNGDNDVVLADLYVYRPQSQSWVNLSVPKGGVPPFARGSHGFTAAGKQLYVHGGCREYDASKFCTGIRFGDLYAFDQDTRIWTNLSVPHGGLLPQSRCFHGFTAMAGLLYVHGGTGEIGYLADLHVFNPDTQTWTDLSASAEGIPPSARGFHGFTACGGRLYVHDGWGERGIISDLHVYDPITQAWTDLSMFATISVPRARWGHGFTATGSRLYVHGGYGGGFLQDLHAITAIREVPWQTVGAAGWGWLVQVFDWDIITVNGTLVAFSQLNMCTGFFPCKLYVRGGAGAMVNMIGDVQLLCLARRGCSGVSLLSVAIVCTNSTMSILKMQSTFLDISDVSFAGCTSATNGGVVSAYDTSKVTITDSNFTNIRSDGFGGAISAFGSNLRISGSYFYNCSSSNGGGSIWASAFPDCFDTKETVKTYVHISASTFTFCHATGDGGAILVTSPEVDDDDMLLAIYLVSTRIDLCSSNTSGGAISASGSIALSLMNCTFDGNIAWGIGGGAVHLNKCFFASYKSLISNSHAPLGGGGALHWQGYIKSTIMDCPVGTGNVAISCASVLADAASCGFGTCTPCRLGSYSNDGSTCLQCPPGTYSPVQGLIDCISCPPGSYSSFVGAYSSSFCKECGVGTYSTGSRSTCLQCPPGTFSLQEGLTSAADCVRCPANISVLLDGLNSSMTNRNYILNACTYSMSFATKSSDLRWVLLNGLAGNGFPSGVGSNTVGQESVKDQANEDLKIIQHQAHEWNGILDIENANKNHTQNSRAYETRKQVWDQLSMDLMEAKIDTRKTKMQVRDTLSANIRFENDSNSLFSLCGTNNDARFGPCLATDFWSLIITSGIPKQDNPAYPGGTIALTVTKKDAYNQTILSDSSSLLEVQSLLNGSMNPDPSVVVLGATVEKLTQGTASLHIQVKPSYTIVRCDLGVTILQSIPFVYIHGLDSQSLSTTMHTLPISVPLTSSFNICPKGYVLTFDSPGQDVLKGPALCQRCPAGTYSVSPLAGKNGFSNMSVPGCLNCPAGGNCLQGGNSISFALGTWILDVDQYRLAHCPPGTYLVNSTSGNSKGTFHHEVQQCKECQLVEYILNPDTDVCQTCPPGLACDSTDAVMPKLNGSRWVRSGSIYRLESCPTGFSVSSGMLGAFDATAQQCSPCGKGEECTTEICIKCSPCKPNFFKPDKSTDTCSQCPASNYNTLHGSQDLSACQTCPSGGICSDGSCAFRNSSLPSCPDGGKIVGLWNLSRNSGTFHLVQCPDGYIKNFDNCQKCPASFYCTGGLPSPCKLNYFSLPGSKSAQECSPSVFVVVSMNLPISRPLFVQTDAFQKTFASIIRVGSEYVIVDAIQAGKNAGTTDVTSKIATMGAFAAESLMRTFATLESNLRSGLSTMGQQYMDAILLSVTVTACVPGYELQAQPPPSTCQLCLFNYFCIGNAMGRTPCPGSSFSDSGSNSSASCLPFAARVSVIIPLQHASFSVTRQDAFRSAIASSTGISPSRISIVLFKNASIEMSRRATTAYLEIISQIAFATAEDATALISNMDISSLNKNLQAQNFPESSSLSTKIISSVPEPLSGLSVPMSVVAGASVGGIFALFLMLFAGFFFIKTISDQRAHKAFVCAISVCKPGTDASIHMIPPKLKSKYVPEKVLGKGSYGCVIKARKVGSDHSTAIKIMLPEKGFFNDKEKRRLQREATVLELFTEQKCPHAVHLAASAMNVDEDARAYWLMLEFLDGKDMHDVLYPKINGAEEKHPINDTECIKLARCVLAALKVMHAEGLVHRDIKPRNIMRFLPFVRWSSKTVRERTSTKSETSVSSHAAKVTDPTATVSYKLIDFGTAIGVDDQVARVEMMTLQGAGQLAGTPPYMSPEMFKAPNTAGYATDIWSLGVTMFEVVTASLPFHSDSDVLWGLAVAGDMKEEAPDVLDVLPEGRRSAFDHNLSKVIAKALKKQIEQRYSSVDEMHDAVYACLIERGEAFYSAFISYRVASEAPLARLLFDELNHSVTPGGHRVTVYWDVHRLVAGEDWEVGFAAGLLNSLIYLPLLSYGFTAPLAALHSETQAQGWDEVPLGRRRLTGSEEDAEDNCLKEILIAIHLLQQRKGRLQVAFPLLVGRQEPQGHPNYPRMGSFFAVQGGGGRFPDRPSPPTARAVSSFLRDRAGFEEQEAADAGRMSIDEALKEITRLQGHQLCNHPKELAGVKLNQEQEELINKGYVGPPVALNGISLSEAQIASMNLGFDDEQLQMLKAEVRAAIPSIHAVIDRALMSTSTTRKRRNGSGLSSSSATVATADLVLKFSSTVSDESIMNQQS